MKAVSILPPYIPIKKVKEMNEDEFLDYLEQRRKYGPGMKSEYLREWYESKAYKGFNEFYKPEPNMGIVTESAFWKIKTGNSELDDREYLKERYFVEI